MSLPRGSLRTFLESARTSLHNAIANQQRVTIVVGNESADLDSITSALVFAFLKSNSSASTRATTSQHPPLYIPLLNIPRADIRIRPELLKLLPYANLEPSHLITLDDLSATTSNSQSHDGKDELKPANTRVLLVDHNKLLGTLASRGFGDRVVGCIDHHNDEDVIPSDTGNEPRIIETAGSCTSLVARYCHPAWDSLSDTASSASNTASGQEDASIGSDDTAVRRKWDAQVAKLAIASVLIDTTNLQDKHKVQDVDVEVVKYLEAKIHLASSLNSTGWDRDEFFNLINSAKTDLGDLSVNEILRKDYKQWEVNSKQLGVSSVVKTLEWQISHAGEASKFEKDVKDFAAERKLDAYCIMTTSTSDNGEFQRELLLWSMDKRNDEFIQLFEKQSGQDLGLESPDEVLSSQSSDSDTGKLRIWQQKEVKNSRKQVAPMLRKALEG